MHDLEVAVSTVDLAGSMEVDSVEAPCSTVADGVGADGDGAEADFAPPVGGGAAVGGVADGVDPGGVGGAQDGDGVAQGGVGVVPDGDGAGADLAAVGGGRMGSAGPLG